MSSTSMQSLSFITFMMSEKIPMCQTSPDICPTKNMLIISLECTTQLHKSYCAWSFYVATIHCLNYSGPESQKIQFAVYFSDTPVTFKQGQGHQAYNDNVDPEQSDKHAKFERSCFNSVREKATVTGFFEREAMSIISLQCVCKLEEKQRGKGGGRT